MWWVVQQVDRSALCRVDFCKHSSSCSQCTYGKNVAVQNKKITNSIYFIEV